MSHGINPITPVTLPAGTPGASATITVRVQDVVQPDTSTTGSVSIDFNGETATAPIVVNFDGVVAPTATIDIPGVNVAVGEPVQDSATVWRFPVTITAV